MIRPLLNLRDLRRVLCLVLLTACSPTAQTGARTMPTTPSTKSFSLDIYLLIGQSNMAGRAQFADKNLPPLQGVSLLNGEDTWEPAENPLNRFSTIRKDLSMQRLGPGYSFARSMHATDPSQALGLVVNARGGSAIAEWARDANFYQETLRRIAIARTSGTLRGILWHQGETDFEDPAYLGKLAELIERLRTDLKLPQLPFVAGEINNIPALNQQLGKLAASVPFTGLASADGLEATDEWHFDTRSILLLGERYADQMQLLIHAP